MIVGKLEQGYSLIRCSRGYVSAVYTTWRKELEMIVSSTKPLSNPLEGDKNKVKQGWVAKANHLDILTYLNLSNHVLANYFSDTELASIADSE